jgi:hypothetical protein
MRRLIGLIVGSSLCLCGSAMAQRAPAIPQGDEDAQLIQAATREARCKRGRNVDGSCISKAQAANIGALRKHADCMAQARINYNWCPTYTPSTDDDGPREKFWELFGRGPTGVAPPPPTTRPPGRFVRGR